MNQPADRKTRSVRTWAPFAALTCALLGATLSGCSDDGDGGSSPPAATSLPSAAALKATCGSLAGSTIAGVTVTSAVRVEPIGNVSTAGLCKVSGTRAPFLDIEVDVPDNWSGRYFQNGGGGFDGTIPSALTADASGVVTAINPAVAVKAAVYAASNGGNRAAVPAQAAPTVWASGTADGQASATDYDYLSVGTTLAFGKGVIDRFFATPAKYRYFNGCSNGGREAYIAAQRWPADFDGIVSGCETEDMTGQTVAWLNIGSRAGTPAALSTPQYRAAYAAAVASCDSQDGLVDGYLTNAATCHLDPASLVCGQGGANSDPTLCLTAPQAQTLKDLMGPVKLANGTVVYAGFNWSDFSVFGSSFGARGGGVALLATGDATWLTGAKQATCNVDGDYPVVGNGLQRTGADHDRAAIAAFVASGKKLISWHDIGDNLLSPNEHARNDAALVQAIRSLGVADPTTGTRFFLVPANTHAAGQALTQVDWASAIMDWVEKGTAPTQLTYTFVPTGAATTAPRNLPVCLNPLAPHYKGSGDVNAVTSYTCA